MSHSVTGFASILVVFVFACSHGSAQERPAVKPQAGPVLAKSAAEPEGEAKVEPSTIKIVAVPADNTSNETFERLEKLTPADIHASAPKVLTANSGSNAADIPTALAPRSEIDEVQMRKAWVLDVGFGRKVNPENAAVSKASNDDHDDPVNPPASDKFHWKPAIYQSFAAQGFQHAYALIFQEKTRRALKGKFFSDYWESVKAVRGWSDENKFFTNYIAHPMQGSFTGFIFVQNHDRAKKQQFNDSPQYWKDRLKAMAWSAAWSANWELGPISQSSIGNVGKYGRQGWVDLVITPTAGTAWMITEEAIDRYIIRHHDGKSLAHRIILRSFLNPTRSVANVFRFKVPWHRDRDTH